MVEGYRQRRLPGARTCWFLRDEIVEWLQPDETKGNPPSPTTLISCAGPIVCPCEIVKF